MQDVILAIIQGITEFLPISSSGHLLLIPYLFGWPESGLVFDVALHAGTLAATVIYFFPKWWRLFTKGLLQRQAKELRILLYLILATIPAALLGLVAESVIIDTLRQPVIAASMLIVFGLLLGYVEKHAKTEHEVTDLTWRNVLFIGVSQALALVPGVSRSGITMTSGLLMGLKKEEAAEFSFLLLAPVTLGAILTQADEIIASPDTSGMLSAALVSFVVGMAAIHFLLKFINRYGFRPYVWYRVVAGLFFLTLVLLG